MKFRKCLWVSALPWYNPWYNELFVWRTFFNDMRNHYFHWGSHGKAYLNALESIFSVMLFNKRKLTNFKHFSCWTLWRFRENVFMSSEKGNINTKYIILYPWPSQQQQHRGWMEKRRIYAARTPVFPFFLSSPSYSIYVSFRGWNWPLALWIKVELPMANPLLAYR